ncbi:MAG: hypothetical protein ACRENP_19315 [Longimicrobiales bacterium]
MRRESYRAWGEAQDSGSTQELAGRIESLVRSLAGVRAARGDLVAGQLRALFVVPAPEVAPRALTRNVQSALMAALGLSIDARAIFLVPDLPVTQAPANEPAAAVAAPDPKPEAPAPQPVAHRRRAAVGFIALPVSRRASPRLELLELDRTIPDRLYCRVVLEYGGLRHTGTAEAGDEREGGVTLAARATLEALRHVEKTQWIFEGAADVIIGGQRHICVSVKTHEGAPALSGAAPVTDSVEQAVAGAVLNAASLSSAFRDPNHRQAHQR